MKKTFFEKLIVLTLSVFSITVVAQCPTSVSITVLSNTNNGDLTIQPSFSGSTPTSCMNNYSLVNSVNSYFQYSSNTNSSSFLNVGSGTYTLCLNVDSVNYPSGCAAINSCTVITITNTIVPSCTTAFTAYTDSSCGTHFANTSTGATSCQWYINGVSYTTASPVLSLANGTYQAILYNYVNGSFCDSVSHFVTVGCLGGSCHPSFTYSTDSNCVTTFVNTSTGSTTHQWNIDNVVYTSTNPSINLSNGNHYVSLYNYINNSFCDSISQLAVIACGSNTTSPCQANSQFYILADSLNPESGNYYIYDNSSATGTASYLWDFGDNTSSTQQYPFHQYAVPGQYVVCLTVTATSGTTTCSDTYCDSSSVHRMAAGFQMYHLVVVPQTVTGIKQTEKEIGLKAFPNPITDELTIEVSSVENNQLNYMLMDALGQIVLTGKTEPIKTIINTSTLQKGFYSLRLSNEKGETIRTIKLVK